MRGSPIFGAALRDAREESWTPDGKKLTAEVMAAYLGIAPSTYLSYESGQRALPWERFRRILTKIAISPAAAVDLVAAYDREYQTRYEASSLITEFTEDLLSIDEDNAAAYLAKWERDLTDMYEAGNPERAAELMSVLWRRLGPDGVARTHVQFGLSFARCLAQLMRYKEAVQVLESLKKPASDWCGSQASMYRRLSLAIYTNRLRKRTGVDAARPILQVYDDVVRIATVAPLYYDSHWRDVANMSMRAAVIALTDHYGDEDAVQRLASITDDFKRSCHDAMTAANASESAAAALRIEARLSRTPERAIEVGEAAQFGSMPLVTCAFAKRTQVIALAKQGRIDHARHVVDWCMKEFKKADMLHRVQEFTALESVLVGMSQRKPAPSTARLIVPTLDRRG